MHLLITGGAGFIGQAALHPLLAANAPGEAPRRIVGLDIAPAPPDSPWHTHPRCRLLHADAADPDALDLAWAAMDQRVDAVLALGATLTTQAEAEFDRAFEVNVLGLRQLLQRCRAQQAAGGPRVRLVFTSSIACFGGDLPEVVDDHLKHAPETSYGTHKAIAELMLQDFSRHGFVDGRALRLPIVVLRPGAPGSSVSDRVAGLVREPLRGQDVVCPWRADTVLPLASVHTVARALHRLLGLPAQALGGTRALNLPALSLRVDEWVAAGQQAGSAARGRVLWRPDPALQAIVDAWPRRFVSARADALGLQADASAQQIVARFLADHPLPPRP